MSLEWINKIPVASACAETGGTFICIERCLTNVSYETSSSSIQSQSQQIVQNENILYTACFLYIINCILIISFFIIFLNWNYLLKLKFSIVYIILIILYISEMSNLKFCVVRFLESNTVEIISEKWLCGLSTCLFPVEYERKKVLEHKQPSQSWGSYGIKILKTSGT